MTITTQQLDQLEAAYQKATPGGWQVYPGVIGAESREGSNKYIGQFDNKDNNEYIVALHNAFPALLAAAREQVKGGWISVDERLPEGRVGGGVTSFLVWTDSQFNPQIATFCTQWDYPWCLSNSSKRVTHWQPLPAPPAEGE